MHLCFWFVLFVVATKIPLEKAAQVAGTQQNLSNLLYFRYLWELPTVNFCIVCMVILVAHAGRWVLQLENRLNYNEMPDIRLVKILMDMVIILLHNFVGLLCYLTDLHDFDE